MEITKTDLSVVTGDSTKTVSVYGVPHLNTEKSWDLLQKDLSKYDAVLCEGVLRYKNMYGCPVKKSFSGTKCVYSRIADLIGYKTQTWFYNRYGKNNWYSIDVSSNFLLGMIKIYLKIILRIAEITIRKSPRLRRYLIESLENIKEIDKNTNSIFRFFVCNKREALVSAETTNFIKSKGVNKVAVLYGNGHTEAIIENIIKDLK